ncbi:perlwapin-like [Amphibalanus amphitrite]|uniref:perlwapin-like n=1 Tax=Amphibalanus amphitrite TaxID=1232801 RepID=UPI001C916D73|nr:perlwapin-like [Amphibalanus amphitrite]
MCSSLTARPGRCPSSESELEERDALLRELVPCRPSRPEQLECPTALKCCQLAGNHFCLPPVPEITADIQAAVVAEDPTAPKPGGCPHAPLERLRCRQPKRNLCLWDSHCWGRTKCCPSGCGLVCQPPARPGSCPAISWHVAVRCWRDGRPKCYRANDHQCPQGLKCCHNGCVFSCVPPDEVLSTKAGFCPPPSFIDDFRPPCRGSSRVNVCDADDHCPGPKKCCPSLCSRQCVLPLIEYR